MRTRFVVMAMVSLTIIIWAIPGLSSEPKIDQQKNFYLQRINEEIANYSCKVDFITSDSRRLQVYGEKAALRAVYLSRNKDSLAQEMVLQQVSLRPHSVHQYLLKRCNQELASK